MRADVERVAHVSPEDEFVHAVAVRIDEAAAPMRRPLISGRIDPDDAVRARVGDDRIGGSRGTAAVATARVEPGDGVVDDRDALLFCVLLGLCQRDLGVDADEVQLGSRRHLVHDFGDSRAVDGGRGQLSATEVRRRHRRQLTLADALLVPREAQVDDSDLHALAGVAGGVKRRRVRRGDSFAGDRRRLEMRRGVDRLCPRVARQRVERVDGDERLGLTGGARLDGAAGCDRRGCRVGSRENHADAIATNGELVRLGGGEGGGRAAAFGCSDCAETRVEPEAGTGLPVRGRDFARRRWIGRLYSADCGRLGGDDNADGNEHHDTSPTAPATTH